MARFLVAKTKQKSMQNQRLQQRKMTAVMRLLLVELSVITMAEFMNHETLEVWLQKAMFQCVTPAELLPETF